MEAPEIIWLSPNECRSNEPSCFWSESQRTDYDIEYIRKDAFIEKAAYYIANNMQCNGYTLQIKGKFIRDFKKYMEE